MSKWVLSFSGTSEVTFTGYQHPTFPDIKCQNPIYKIQREFCCHPQSPARGGTAEPVLSKSKFQFARRRGLSILPATLICQGPRRLLSRRLRFSEPLLTRPGGEPLWYESRCRRIEFLQAKIHSPLTNEPLCRCVETERRRATPAPERSVITGLTSLTTMGYMQDSERELREKIEKIALTEPSVEEVEEFITFVKAKLLQSYRNGQRDCPKCNPKPQKSRAKG